MLSPVFLRAVPARSDELRRGNVALVLIDTAPAITRSIRENEPRLPSRIPGPSQAT
jgi:hypothetical protein